MTWQRSCLISGSKNGKKKVFLALEISNIYQHGKPKAWESWDLIEQNMQLRLIEGSMSPATLDPSQTLGAQLTKSVQWAWGMGSCRLLAHFALLWGSALCFHLVPSCFCVSRQVPEFWNGLFWSSFPVYWLFQVVGWPPLEFPTPPFH